MEAKYRRTKEFSREEIFAILKQYDPKAYEHYANQAWYFGATARNYAISLYYQNHPEEKEFEKIEE